MRRCSSGMTSYKNRRLIISRLSSSGEIELCSARSMKQIALSGTVLLQPQFSFPHQGIPDAKKRPERRVKSGFNAVAVESLPEFYMRRLACTARRGKSYALPVKRNKSGMKNSCIIIENGGADLFLHCDALQKSIRKHLRRAQKKLSELLFVFFIGPNRKQRSLIGEVLTAHIRKVRVRAGDTYR